MAWKQFSAFSPSPAWLVVGSRHERLRLLNPRKANMEPENEGLVLEDDFFQFKGDDFQVPAVWVFLGSKEGSNDNQA